MQILFTLYILEILLIKIYLDMYICEFYPFKSEFDGYHVQRISVEKTEVLTKKQLFNIADLRHNVLNKKEYFSLITQNKNEFELLTPTHLIKAKLKKKISN